MGEPAPASEAERARRRELAAAIVKSVEDDERMPLAVGYETDGAGFHRTSVEELSFSLAQEIQQLIGGELYLVVMKDRRIDDQFSLHLTRADADAAIEDFKELYGSEENDAWTERAYGRPRWVRYVNRRSEEGPNARIEIIGIVGR